MNRWILLVILSLVNADLGRADDGVILLHGLARTSKSMGKIEKALLAQGYQVANVAYPSRKGSIEDLATSVKQQILEESKDWEEIHFVTHSMGGILVRQIQKTEPLDRMGRVVMLAPPNQGSEVVDRLGPTKAFRWANGVAGQQLGTDGDGFIAGLGPVEFELGVIAGDRSVNPLLSKMIKGKNDGKVSVERAKVNGMADFKVVHASHPFIMRKGEVIHSIVRFLQDGRFDAK